MTKTEIANYALYSIGHGAIASLTEGSAISGRVQLLLPVAEAEVLRAHPWTSCLSRITIPMGLMPASSTGDSPYTYGYTLPASVAKVLELASGNQWKVEGQTLYTDDEDPEVLAVVLQDQYEAMIGEAIALRLAYRLAVTIMNDQSRQQTIQAEYNAIISQAMAASGEDRQSNDTGNKWWYDV